MARHYLHEVAFHASSPHDVDLATSWRALHFQGNCTSRRIASGADARSKTGYNEMSTSTGLTSEQTFSKTKR